MRLAILTLAAIASLGVGLAAGGRQSAQAPSASGYLFRADTGLLVFHVHRERSADFEEVINQITIGAEQVASAANAGNKRNARRGGRTS